MKTRAIIATVMLAIFTLTANAQDNNHLFGIEVNGGASFATNELNNTELKPGFGFEGIVHFRFMPHMGAYAGWGWNRLNAEQSFAGEDICFEETGYMLGLQFKHPISSSSINYFLRGAALYNHIEIENGNGEIINDSGHGFGWQAAAGLDIPFASGWSVMPGVKFNSLNRNTDFNSESINLNQNYLSARIGILKTF